MYDNIVKLIALTYSTDSIGQHVPVESAGRTVFCDVGSISRAEWFDAGQNGLKPELKIVVNQLDYQGETIVEYAHKRYSVYRTYMVNTNDTIELYLEEKAGTR